MTLNNEQLSSTSSTARANHLEFLLHGVLEVQALVTEADFNLEKFMQRTVDLAESLTGAKGAVVELVDGEDMLYSCASSSIRQHVGLRLRRATSFSGLCIAQKRALRCDDADHDLRVDREACRKVGVRSMICTPLFQTGQAVGVLKVMSGEVRAFDSNHQYLLDLLAGALGAALGKHVSLEALRTSEETFRSAMETTLVGMALVDLEGHFLRVNTALCGLLGYTEAELLANGLYAITHPDDREACREVIQSALQGVGDRHKLEKRYYHKSGGEVWVLLSIALVRGADAQPRYFVTQMHDVSEQHRAARMKDEFVSTVSHELRTPLTAINGALGLIIGTMARELPEKVCGLLEIAQGNAERLIHLTNDILDVEKIASGNMRFETREHSLARITTAAVRANESYAEKFSVRIELAPLDEQIRIAVDEQRYFQVLSNLISNAAKFSRIGATVVVTSDIKDGYARICVTDQGQGIAPEFRERIFGKFSQADSSASRRVGGTGLGLHIARQIVERMHGRIGFDSEPGCGATFWIEFPSAGAASG